MSEEKVIAEYSVDFKKTHSQTLLPMVAEIMKMTETSFDEIDVVAVAKGPGSFTGLRIGAATAKGLCITRNLPLIGIDTLSGLANNVISFEGIICPLMDARRNQVYTALYKNTGNGLECIMQPSAIDISEIIEKINGMKEKVIFLGDGVVPYKSRIEAETKVSYTILPNHLVRQRAASVGQLAVLEYLKGNKPSADTLELEYLRVSQAERETGIRYD
ncbi:MAG: tRNA (adenosine(37)-N6)-threonylcarbamoyltransferase complex dimerization subunit type 1 TsaB [Lachnospiraceae bacterium]|nr:tRNA (adenosine(37)-N6)-threonylcarbamoyltransferase complex dimerization subunit type 1 TsaB [Lachnospiraceae bacterium]